MKKVDVRYYDDSGCYHVILIYKDGTEVDVAQHCDEQEADDAANEINRWSQE
jgi:hypothetical protein